MKQESDPSTENFLFSEALRTAATTDDLFSTAPAAALTLNTKLRDCTEINEDYHQYLQDRPDIQASSLLPPSFLRHGVSPSALISSTHAVANLLARAIDRKILPDREAIILSAKGAHATNGDTPIVLREHFIIEVKQTTYCEEDVANALFDWTLEVGALVPMLFNGFLAIGAEDKGLKLVRNES